MNTDNNARFQETEERIMQAYGNLVRRKPSAQITVSDICREAGIHRTTFYGHYCDILDLEEKVERKQLLRLLAEFQIEEKWDAERGMLAITGFCRKYKDIFKRQLKTLGGNADGQLMNPEFMRSMEEKFSRYLQFDDGEERMYYRRFCEVGIMAVLTAWVENDCKEPDAMITGIICNILDGISA